MPLAADSKGNKITIRNSNKRQAKVDLSYSSSQESVALMAVVYQHLMMMTQWIFFHPVSRTTDLYRGKQPHERTMTLLQSFSYIDEIK